MVRIGIGLLAAISGMSGLAVSNLAQAASPDLSPWVSGGSATVAVAGLAYVARQLASGKLVHSDTAARERALEDLTERAMAAFSMAADREADYRKLLMDAFGKGYGRRTDDKGTV